MTPKQRELLTFIVEYQADSGDVTPSFDEMRDALKLRSKSGIHRLLSALEQQGYIQRKREMYRAIKVLDKSDVVSVAELNAMVHRLAAQEGPQRIAEALADLARSLALEAQGTA